jgi:putative membrane protein
MFFDHGYFMGGMHGMWWVFWLVVAVVVAVAIWAPQRQRRSSADEASPRDILQRRLARGEITPEAYEQAKALLDRDAPRN